MNQIAARFVSFASNVVTAVSLIVFLLIAGADITSPSLFSILALLGAVFCVGARLVALFVDDTLLQVTVGLQVGLALVVIAMLIPFATMMNLPLGLRPFVYVVMAVSSVLTDAAYFAKRDPSKNNLLHYVKTLRNTPIKSYLPILAVFGVAAILRMMFALGNTSTILPDGALNFAAARSLETAGSFSSNMLSEAHVTSPFSSAVGLNLESGTWMILSMFFSEGGVSFSVNLVMLQTFGLVLLMPIYSLGRSWFGTRGWIPTMIASCLPILLFFSSVPYGAEIVAAVFAISAISILEFFRVRIGRIPTAGFLFAGILLSISAVAWDTEAALVFVVAYGVLLLLEGPDSKTNYLLILLMSLAFGISVLYSETWNLNPWVFTLFVFLFAVVGWVWKRRKPNLELALAFMSLTFSLWLSRFYLLPQYVIEPSLAYLGRKTPSTVFPFSSTLSSLISHTMTYWSNLSLGATYPLILLSVASIFLLRRVGVKQILFAYLFLLLDAISIIVTLSPSVGFFTSFSATRFLIVSYVLLVLLSSAAIVSVFNRGSPKTRLALFPRRGLKSLPNNKRNLRRRMMNRNNLWTILVVFFLAISIVSLIYSFETQYGTAVAVVHSEDYPQFLGILSSENWIQQNIKAGTVFQVASGDSASVWAMEIGDMSFAATNLVSNGTEIPYSAIGISDVLTAASTVNATYIIIDSDVINLGMTHLHPYFDVSSSSVGETFSVLPNSSNSSILIQSDKGTSLRLVYVNGIAPEKVVIYQIETSK